MANSKIELIIFELDDVILDTSILYTSALINAIRSYYPEFNLAECHFMSHEYYIQPYKKLLKFRHITKCPMQIIDKIFFVYKEMLKESISYIYLKDDVKNTLMDIKNKDIKTAVVTNTEPSILKSLVKVSSLDQYVNTIKSASDISFQAPMPDPQIIYFMAKKFKVSKNNILFVDKSEHGCYTGIKAGIKTLEIYPNELSHALNLELI